MAGTSNKTTVVGVRVPNDTLAEWQSVIGDRAMAAYVLERAMRPDAALRVAELEVECNALQAQVHRLQFMVDHRREVKLGFNHHAAGPVLADAVPDNLAGQAVGFRPKASWKDKPK